MKMSTKGRYAVMAMIDIATHSDGAPVSLAEIAERQDISQEYLEQLFGKLRKAKLVESSRGPGGGYTLAHKPEEISVADIIVAVDEPLDATQCGGKGNCHSEEDTHSRCMTHDLWTNLNAKMVEYLDSVTLRDLVKQQESRGVVIADMREKKVRVEPAKLKKTAVAAVTKKEEAPKRPLINSVFNLARQG